MTVVTVEDAQPMLKELLKQVEDGEAVVITTESGARLRVLREERAPGNKAEEQGPAQGGKRQFGQWAGRFEVGPEFFEPLPDDELALWLGESERGRQLEQIGEEWALRNKTGEQA